MSTHAEYKEQVKILPQGARFAALDALARGQTPRPKANEAPQKPAVQNATVIKATAGKPPRNPSSPSNGSPSCSAAESYAPPAPSEAQIRAKIEREAREAEAARAADAKRRREAADASWARANASFALNTCQTAGTPAAAPVKTYTAAQIANAGGISIERMSVADAAWERADAAYARQRAHLR